MTAPAGMDILIGPAWTGRFRGPNCVIMVAQQSAPPSNQAVVPFLFYGFAALTVLSAWGIVAGRNIVRMAVYLLLTLAGVAGFYFMLSAEFLAAIQLIVYAGGTLILIVFGVMLTSRHPTAHIIATGWERVLGVVVATVLAVLLLIALAGTPAWPTTGLGTSIHAGGAGVAGYSSVQTIGKALLSGYAVPFEVGGVLLLVVMIGAAYMARRRTR